MFKILIPLIVSIPIFALVDLGNVGPTEKIKEVDLNVAFNEKVKSLNYKEIEKKIVASESILATVKSPLPACKADRRYSKDNIQISKVSYYDLDGNPYVLKGDKFTVRYPIKTSVCIIDGSNIKIAKKSMKRLLSIGRCDKTMVANRDFRKFKSLNSNGKFYPYNKQLAEISKANCLPMRAEMYKDKIKIDELVVHVGDDND